MNTAVSFRAAMVATLAVCAQAAIETNAPLRDTSLRLRQDDDALSFSPQIAGELPLEMKPLAPSPLAATTTLARAQAAVLLEPDSWRAWAALARAHYAAGNYEKAHAAARQMRAAAAAQSAPLPLAADELFAQCLRAAEALTLLE